MLEVMKVGNIGITWDTSTTSPTWPEDMTAAFRDALAGTAIMLSAAESAPPSILRLYCEESRAVLKKVMAELDSQPRRRL